MKISKSTEIKVGLLLFAGIALLVLGVIFGKGLNLTSGGTEIKFMFPNSGGLKLSDPIYVNGVKRGYVQSIENYNGQVLVKGTLDNIADLKADLTAKILILEITGGKKIEIDPGQSSVPFDAKNIIPGSTPPDIAELVAIFGDASKEILGIVHKIDTTLSSINSLFANKQFIDNLVDLANNTQQLTSQLNELVTENQTNLNSIIKDLKTTTSEIKTFVANNKDNFDKIVKNLDTISTRTNPLLKKADSLFQSISQLTNNLNKITSDIQYGNGTLSKLLNDQQFARKLESTLMSIDSLVNTIQKYGVNVNVRLGSRP